MKHLFNGALTGEEEVERCIGEATTVEARDTHSRLEPDTFGLTAAPCC